MHSTCTVCTASFRSTSTLVSKRFLLCSGHAPETARPDPVRAPYRPTRICGASTVVGDASLRRAERAQHRAADGTSSVFGASAAEAPASRAVSSRRAAGATAVTGAARAAAAPDSVQLPRGHASSHGAGGVAESTVTAALKSARLRKQPPHSDGARPLRRDEVVAAARTVRRGASDLWQLLPRELGPYSPPRRGRTRHRSCAVSAEDPV